MDEQEVPRRVLEQALCSNACLPIPLPKRAIRASSLSLTIALNHVTATEMPSSRPPGSKKALVSGLVWVSDAATLTRHWVMIISVHPQASGGGGCGCSRGAAALLGRCAWAIASCRRCDRSRCAAT